MTIPEVAPRLEASSFIISIQNKVCKLFEQNQLQVLTGFKELLKVTYPRIMLRSYDPKMGSKRFNLLEVSKGRMESSICKKF